MRRVKDFLGVRSVLAIGLLCVVASPVRAKDRSAKGHEEEKVIEWAALPAPVQQAAKAELGGAAPIKIESEKRGGMTAYEVKYEKGGAVQEVKFSADGVLIERESEVAVPDLPKAVMAQIRQAHPKAKVLKAEAVELRFFEVKVEENGKKRTVKLLPSGRSFKDD